MEEKKFSLFTNQGNGNSYMYAVMPGVIEHPESTKL